MKLHAALVLNITFWAITDSAVDVARCFNDRVSLTIFLCQQPGEKNHFVSKQN